MGGFEEEIKKSSPGSRKSYRKMLEEGCKKIGLLSKKEELVRIIKSTKWRRGGYETYVSEGKIILQKWKERKIRNILAKAYAGFGIGVSPKERVYQWEQRAKKLKKSGIPVAKVYGTQHAVLFSRYIKYELIDFLKSHRSYASKYGRMLSNIAKKMDNIGVKPVCLLSDLRTDGETIYVTDYGEDMGHIPEKKSKSTHCKNLLKSELEKYGLASTKRYFSKQK